MSEPKFKTLSEWFNNTGHEMGKSEFDLLKETVSYRESALRAKIAELESKVSSLMVEYRQMK